MMLLDLRSRLVRLVRPLSGVRSLISSLLRLRLVRLVKRKTSP